MKAAVWHGRRDVRVDEVADPTIQEPTDAIVEITTTGRCGSDLHLDEVLAPFMTEGDILRHEASPRPKGPPNTTITAPMADLVLESDIARTHVR